MNRVYTLAFMRIQVYHLLYIIVHSRIAFNHITMYAIGLVVVAFFHLV